MSPITNILENLLPAAAEETIETLLKSPQVRIERIVSHGHASPPGFWYDQDQNEWVLLIAGAARLRFEDGTIELTPGSVVNISAHRRHRVEWTDPNQATIWLAVYY